MSRRLFVFLSVAPWASLLFTVLLFLVLQYPRTLTLSIQMEVHAKEVAAGEVWWTVGKRPFHPSDSVAFRAGPDVRRVTVTIPVEIETVQIRPCLAAGCEVAVTSLSLATPFVPLHRWDSKSGFTGWRAVEQLDRYGVEGGLLRMRTVGQAGAFQVDDLTTLRYQVRRRRHFALAGAGGVLLGLLQGALAVTLMRLFSSGGAEAGQLKGGAPAPRGAWLLFAGTTALCTVIGVVAARALLRQDVRSALPDDGQYSLTFVDTLGRRLSEKDGTLKLVLDPFSFYRNFPNQKTRRFTIDSHGYRGGFSPDDPRPRVLILGGSTTFGFGLNSDEETVAARLQALEPRWQVVNAAVVGHLSGQELSELVHRGDDVRPAAVVVLDGWNDVYVSLFAAIHFPTTGMPTGQNWDVFHLVADRLRLLTLAGTPEAAIPVPERPLDELRREVAETYQRNLKRMSDVAKSRGARFIAVFQPWLPSRARPANPGEEAALRSWKEMGSRGDPAIYDRFVAEACAFCNREGIPFVDLHGSDQFRDPKGSLFIDAIHPNAEGHARMAEALRPLLAALLP